MRIERREEIHLKIKKKQNYCLLKMAKKRKIKASDRFLEEVCNKNTSHSRTQSPSPLSQDYNIPITILFSALFPINTALNW